MRPTVVSILAALALAGCLAPAPDASPAGAMEPAESAEAAAVEPLALEITHSYLESAGSQGFEIPAGARNVRFELLLQGADGNALACPGTNAWMGVAPPGSDAIWAVESQGGAGVNGIGTGVFCDAHEESVDEPAAGAWTVEFSGNGAVTGILRVTS